MRVFLLALFCCVSFCVFGQDTINQTDAQNQKQGHWVYRNDVKKLPGYKVDQVVEEGRYKDNRKVGMWTFYFNNGKIKHQLTYTNGKPDGPAIFYYKNGNKREEGNWKGNRWVGAYKSYYENGNLRNDFTYNTNGEKSGVQKYYYESGKLQVQGEWKLGQETGKIVEYYENGSVKSEKTFNNGEFVGEQTYEKKDKPAEPVVASKQVTPATVSLKEDTVAVDSAQHANVVKKSKPAGLKDLNGQQEILDRDGRVSKTGEFKNGFLIEGKKFEYDPSGKLIKTFIVKKGKVVKVIDHQQEKKKG